MREEIKRMIDIIDDNKIIELIYNLLRSRLKK